jgi:hypothetical protein
MLSYLMFDDDELMDQLCMATKSRSAISKIACILYFG